MEIALMGGTTEVEMSEIVSVGYFHWFSLHFSPAQPRIPESNHQWMVSHIAHLCLALNRYTIIATQIHSPILTKNLSGLPTSFQMKKTYRFILLLHSQLKENEEKLSDFDFKVKNLQTCRFCGVCISLEKRFFHRPLKKHWQLNREVFGFKAENT